MGRLEEQKEKSGKGFDTSVNNKLGSLIKLALILLAIMAAALLVYSYLKGGSSDGSIGGGQRNCILSVMGNPPDCSDDDGTAKATYANGKYKGICTSLDNSGNCLS